MKRAPVLVATLLCSVALAARAQVPTLVPEDVPPNDSAVGKGAPALRDATETPPNGESTPASETAAPIVGNTTETPSQWYEDLQFNAFFSGAVVHNFAQQSPRQSANATRVFDARNDSLKVDGVQLALQNEATAPGEAGFRVDLVWGQSLPTALNNGVITLQQAFATYLAPVGTGLRIDAGTFRSHIGVEGIEGFDQINDTYSRGLVFTTIPQLLTGVRLGYVFCEALRASLFAVNGWLPNFIDNNQAKSVGGQVAYAPHKMISITASYLGGAEQTDNSHAWRHLVDLVATLDVRPLAVNLEGVWGVDTLNNTLGDEAAQWLGVAGAVRWDITSNFALAARGEFLDNHDPVPQPFASQLRAQVFEVTLSPSLRFSDLAVLRIDARHDRTVGSGDPEIFLTSNGSANHQTTVAANLVFVF